MVDFQSFVGKIFGELEFYELMLFEIEENLEDYLTKNVHLYFDRLPAGKIQITEIRYFGSSKEMDRYDRQIIEKKEWFELYENGLHGEYCNWWFCRFDRTGKVSSVYADKETITSPWKHGWADEHPMYGQPMTEEDIRRGIMELCGAFEESVQLFPLRSKKSV